MNQVDFKAALEALRQEYLANLPSRVDEIEALWRALCELPWDAEKFQTFTRLAHSLAGSGATYGFIAVSDAARALERFLKALPGETRPAHAAQAEIAQLIFELRRAANAASDEPDAAAAHDPPHSVTPAPELFVPHSARQAPARTVILYEPNRDRAREIETQLALFDFQIRCVENFRALGALETLPAAVILNWDAALQDPTADFNALENFRRAEAALPMMFISERDDLTARLDAVRFGATVYLIAPLAPNTLIEVLEEQVGARNAEPFRILIVEDDPQLAQWTARVLESANMTTRCVTDPLQVMAPLIDFRPDLILSDMHMPHLNGLELAAVLRLQEAYVSIPIVFLSSETDLNLQLSAMLTGGDDFLLKPIEPHHLVTKVTSRVRRARTLRKLAERDSLTGLLNHTRFKERLTNEIARAQRTQTPLTFAMLDIDLFKRVNDTYGHPTGDRVLKSLARLLIQSLRKSDILGRYGGEEFAIILPETPLDAAYQVVEELRGQFEQIRHYSGGQEFHVTFSGGLAALTPDMQNADLSEAADRALYQAKRNGRNQIVAAIE